MEKNKYYETQRLKSVLIIGSSGKLGSMLTKKLMGAGSEVFGLDVNKSNVNDLQRFIEADLTVPQTLPDLSGYGFDVLLVATPASVADAVINNVIVPYGKSCLIVDFLSEKHFFEQHLKNAVKDIVHIGVHPLFAPAVDWKNQNVLVTPRKVSDARAQQFIRQLEEWEAVVQYCDAVEHDKLMSVVQVGVHAAVIAYAQFLVSQDIDFKLLDKISTPASRVMWAMVARMIANNPSVYWEIQTNSATAQNAREGLTDSINMLDKFVKTSDSNSFDEIFNRMRSMFGDDLEKYERLANELFNHQPGKID